MSGCQLFGKQWRTLQSSSLVSLFMQCYVIPLWKILRVGTEILIFFLLFSCSSPESSRTIFVVVFLSFPLLPPPSSLLSFESKGTDHHGVLLFKSYQLKKNLQKNQKNHQKPQISPNLPNFFSQLQKKSEKDFVTHRSTRVVHYVCHQQRC
jgi:hypothetical protein